MSAFADKREVRINRVQNLVILLLTLSAAFLFACLPLFGTLSDQSLLELAQDRMRRENAVVQTGASGAAQLALPLRMVYTNDFARLGADAETTLSAEFERAGTYLSEAIGSAGDAAWISETVFLSALRGEGLFFDFTAPLPAPLLSGLLGVEMPTHAPEQVRRMLLCPAGAAGAIFYMEDGDGVCYRCDTAVSSSALADFLASQSGRSVDFAFLLGPAYAALSPFTIIFSDAAPCRALSVTNAVPLNEDAFLRRAGFNSHTENRFTESSGTVIVREVSSTLYLRPDGTVEYRGGDAAADSAYFVPAAEPGAPTLFEAASAAQRLLLSLTQIFPDDAALCLSGARETEEGYEICFDLTADGTPIRFADGAHAAVVEIAGQSVRSFTLRARSYTLTEETTALLPFALSAAIARVWDGAELLTAYVDAGGDTAECAWLAE